jgi:Cysteine-rich CPXCG
MPRRRRRAHCTYTCPHCGEEVDSYPDPGGGESQSYIEDCSVCCRPNRITAVLDPDSGDFFLDACAEG